VATKRFLHMRLTPEDCNLLDLLVERVNEDEELKAKKRPHAGRPPSHFSQSDVVRIAVAEALLRRCEERV